MATLWMAAVLLGVTPGDGTPTVAADSPVVPAVVQPVVEPRKGPELRGAVRAALKAWARPSDRQADHAARVFLVLYQELERDDQLAPTQRKELLQKVRGRLMHLAGRIQTRLAVERRLAREKQPASVDVADRPKTLGQFGGGGFGGMGGGGMGGFGGGMGGGGMGGMGGGGMGMRPGGNSMVGDASGDLIELIQRTIAPASWDVNGGPGAIYYFRPNHAMVITNTGEIHEQVGGVLDQLRRAGN